MTPAWEITVPLLELIRHELASGRTSVARLAKTSGVSRGTIYATLTAPSQCGSLGVLSLLAEALGAEITLVVQPGVGPAHGKPKRCGRPARTIVEETPTAQVLDTGPPPSLTPPLEEIAQIDAAPAADVAQPVIVAHHPDSLPPPTPAKARLRGAKRYRPNIERWRSDGVMNRAWLRRPGNVLAIAKSLRMNSWACRRRYMVMGLLEPQNAKEAARIEQYRAIAQARCAGCSIRQVATHCNVSTDVAKQTLRMLSISGRTRTAPPRTVDPAEVLALDIAGPEGPDVASPYGRSTTDPS